MKYMTGSLEQYYDKRGWITGSFFPENTLNYDKNIEIKIRTVEKSSPNKPHYHKNKKTWIIVINGSVNLLINDEPVGLKSKQFVIFEPGISEELKTAESGTIIITIHTPSTTNDVVEL